MNIAEHVTAQASPPEPSKQATRGKRKARPFPLHQRRKDLARLVVWRHKRLPDDGWNYIKVAAEHCPHGPNRRDALMQWFEHVCAPIPTRRQADDILDRVPPRHWSADALGNHLRVTDAERATLRCYTIGSYQTPKAERIKRRKEKARLAAQARRLANGGKPREQSCSRTKPWEAAGFRCRRTWERHGKPVSQIRTQDTSLPYAYEFATRMDREELVHERKFSFEAPSSTTSTTPVEAKEVELVATGTAPHDFRLKPAKACFWRIGDAVGTVPIRTCDLELELDDVHQRIAELDQRQVHDIDATKHRSKSP